ncbi:alpha/beta hydrolase [Bacillus sp. JJ722]|uniref:alpha/beta hydrolase n=1 Tax=Bacillus sp. JJ722 TaxID=3122973 RepID=UPI002FFF9405
MCDNVLKREVVIPGTEEWLMHSRTNERVYRIMVAKPKQPAPPSGYPIIYVLDGNAYFQTFQEAVRVQSGRSEKTGVNPAIVVGIGYQSEESFDTENRVYDFTPPDTIVDLPKRPNGEPWPKSGGAEYLLRFIEGELKPSLQKRYEIDMKQQTLFGHSLGGLFTLYALFLRSSFQNYIACSPSIWWNKQCIIEYEKQWMSFGALIDTKIVIAVGSLEQVHMVEDAKEMHRRITQSASERIQTYYLEGDGENHASIVPTVLSRALRFINQM